MDAISKGWIIESQGQYHAVIVDGEKINHVLHLLVSVITVGLWIVVWIVLAVFGGQQRLMIYVNEQGEVSVRKI